MKKKRYRKADNENIATSVCPLYCRYCTRAYAVGANTDSLQKKGPKPHPARWEKMFKYIEETPELTDIVVSGGDAFMLEPEDLHNIGIRLLSIPHIRRLRIASKGLAVCPSRFLDPNDTWADALINISDYGRKLGKQVALHTHFNTAKEITWVTRAAALKLFQANVIVRNQTVLLKGVNDTKEVLGELIRELADINIIPVSFSPLSRSMVC